MKQKHDLGRIKRSATTGHPPKSKAEKRKEKARRVAANYARVEARFQQQERERKSPPS